MFVKVTPRAKNGKTYYYAELVEAFREYGKVKHKRLLYFGSVDLETAERLKIVFSKDFDSFTNLDRVDFSRAVPYGNFFLINIICRLVSMFEIFRKRFVIKEEDDKRKHITVDTALDCIKALVFQRIVQADSKLALIEWLPNTPMKHFFEHGLQEPDLQTVYRSLEVLEYNFPVVEQCLYEWAEGYFNQNMHELFYDITSSYLEGHQCIIGEFGYSRDHRGDREQIVIGLVTTYDGFPIKCNIYPGSTVDKTTVETMISDLCDKYPIDEFVFVGDRGMLTEKNIEAIVALNQKFVMAIPRAWTKKYLKDIDINENEMEEMKENLFAKFLPQVNGQRFLLCLNTEKRTDDTAFRNHGLQAINEELKLLNASLGTSNKKIKTRDEAMKKVGAILKKNKCGKYFEVKTIDSITNPLGFELAYQIDQNKVASDQRLDGTFVIQTNDQQCEGKRLIEIYKNLNKVETAFRIIKNDLDIRPMYHWKESRVKGHVYVCVLAYFIMIAIEYIAHQKNVKLSARKILGQLSSVMLIQILLPNGQQRYSLTSLSREQNSLLSLYGVKKLSLPDVV